MKLKEFNNSMMGRNSGSLEPVVAITQSGMIRFNKKATKLCDLKLGDKIVFYQDEARPTDWYFSNVSDKNDHPGFPLRSYKGDDKALVFQCAALAKEILASLNLKKAIRLRVGSEPVEKVYWSLHL